MVFVANDEHQVVILQKDGAGQRTGYAAVAIDERVDLGKAVVKPRRLDLRTDMQLLMLFPPGE